ncbi:c-type cytochrome [Stagnihabitans tardus]|uniref:Cytochrome c n=1 Tax=Stagnihabitans tardus TaxID=2699202 RepID=A0AAE4YB74_9RHOB|nr:c-type cytochrome [Stagnihabitans tardus]NBZ89487.1 cytochrome c [Stagnihabitans tardus]
MDFPIYHLDLMGNRLLVAVIAILHVLINHGLAVGLIPLVAAMEWYGARKGDPRWDRLARRILFFAFLITTTVGALTGVGIWLSTSLVNPASIGSLIRVFFWGWFIEWLVFITEVVLILWYHLTWESWQGARKAAHIRLGFALAVFSWVTMAIIVSILGFMMDPGNWLTDHSLWSGFTNPIYLPQLAFRTALALCFAAMVALMLILFFTRRDDPFRYQAVRAVSVFALATGPFVVLAGWWYASVVPETMLANLATGLATMQFEEWQDRLFLGMIGAAALVMGVAQLGVWRPHWVPRLGLLVPLVAVMWLTGHFERVREFIRKPYVIGQYMYANGLRVEDYPLYQSKGLLPYATWTYPLSQAETAAIPAGASVTDVQAGKDVFMIACTRCHTANGVNAVRGHFQRMLGDDPWTPDKTMDTLAYMHEARPFMPPFPGSPAELAQVALYIQTLQSVTEPLAGAQSAGVKLREEAR